MSLRFPPEVEAADEAFWAKQERRKRGSLGQPCCTQSKMSWALMDLPGDLAVVIHGEFDCLNCFHHHLGENAHSFYSTRLTDHQITTGDTQRPLEHLLRLLVAERDPTAVVVLGTCPVEVIGDRFEVVADKVQEDTGTPVVAMHTSGLKMSSLTDCQDWMFESLAKLPQVPASDRRWTAEAGAVAMDLLLDEAEPTAEQARSLHDRLSTVPAPQPSDPSRRVNLVGLPEASREPVEVLGALGLEVNGFFPHGAHLDDWRSISQAAATFAVDRRLMPRLMRTLEGYGQQMHDVVLPIGLAATRRYYEAIAATFDRADALDAVLQPRIDALIPRMEAFREAHGGTRLAMAIRVLNTYKLDQLVQDGLGDAEHLRELGFDLTLLVQGPLEEGPKFEKRLRERGVEVPVRTFPGPFQLGEYLADGGYDAAVVPDSNRNIARRAGLPMLPSRALRPWLSGIEHNLAVLADLATEARSTRGRGGAR